MPITRRALNNGTCTQTADPAVRDPAKLPAARHSRHLQPLLGRDAVAAQHHRLASARCSRRSPRCAPTPPSMQINNDPSVSNFINTGDSNLVRAMPTVGLEYRYPFISVQSWGTQTIEPIAQIIARPNETQVGRWPNEDAQSLDLRRQQPVPRRQILRLGPRRRRRPRQLRPAIHRADSIKAGFVNALFGQSYQLVRTELVRASAAPTNTGLDSGLDTSRVRLRGARLLPAELDISRSVRASASTTTPSTCKRHRAGSDAPTSTAGMSRCSTATTPPSPNSASSTAARASWAPAGQARRQLGRCSAAARYDINAEKFDQTPVSALAISTIASSWP